MATRGKIWACSVPVDRDDDLMYCPNAGQEIVMYNLDFNDTGGALVIVCEGHKRLAVSMGHKVFPVNRLHESAIARSEQAGVPDISRLWLEGLLYESAAARRRAESLRSGGQKPVGQAQDRAEKGEPPTTPKPKGEVVIPDNVPPQKEHKSGASLKEELLRHGVSVKTGNSDNVAPPSPVTDDVKSDEKATEADKALGA